MKSRISFFHRPLSWLIVLMNMAFHPAGASDDKKAPSEPTAIVLPIPVGQGAKGIRFPDFDREGRILSQFIAGQALNMDGDIIRIDALSVELFNKDGEKEFRIDLPSSTLDLKSRHLVSKEPFRLLHNRFEMRGESLDFDAIGRIGVVRGRVHMVIFNAAEILEKPKDEN